MSDWYPAGLEDDMRARIFACADRNEPFALATIIAAEGGGPRGLGAQMVITPDGMAGFLSGGCIEADVALHGRDTLVSGAPVRLVYGHGSPFVDTRLPCGGRLDILVEPIAPKDAVLDQIRAAMTERRQITLVSDGLHREVLDGDRPHADRLRSYAPNQRLIVVGSDAFALAMAQQGLAQGWQVDLVRPNGPEEPPPLAVGYHRDADPGAALRRIGLDRWTAVAVSTHDAEVDQLALIEALASEAAYVGVLGSRRRLPERLKALTEAGAAPEAIARLHAPIGLKIAARSPQEVAVSVIAEIISGIAR